LHLIIIKRLFHGIPVILGVITISFILMYVAPGDPVFALVGEYYDDATLENLRHQLGLDRSLIVQYSAYLKRITTGDLGISFVTGRPVWDDLAEKFPYTLQLALAAMMIAIVAGISLGIFSALKKNTVWDKLSILLSLTGVSAPVFWVALLLILWVGVNLQWLPPTGYGGLKFLVLPAIALGTRSMAMLTRLTRAFMLDTMNEDYITTARAKGVPERWIIFKHAFRNMAIPLITVIGLDFGSYVSGAVLTESVFGWPGIGRFALNAIMKRDFPAIQGSVLFMAVIFVLVNIMVDILYAWVDPRIRQRITDGT